jgi:outer membrane protein, heavy metal efflux system
MAYRLEFGARSWLRFFKRLESIVSYHPANVPRKLKNPLKIGFLLFLGSTICARSERPFPDTAADALRIPASRIHSPQIPPQIVDPSRGIGPDEAASIALYLNPALRAIRDRRGLAIAQLIQAGVLPNVVVSYERDYFASGNPADSATAYSFTAGWEFTALLPFLPRHTAARKNLSSVDLDIAWQEWQVAESARTAVYRVVALDAESTRAREANQGLQESAETMRKAVSAHEKTVLDLAAVESASQDSRATMLSLEQELARQRLGLNRILGVEPQTKVALRTGLKLPSRLDPPNQRDLIANLESRRLDLLGLRAGYESQDATVRAAILASFPKMSLAFVRAKDNTNIKSDGFNVTVEVPIFDRNQGVIATERATRQRLRDEYNQRVFEARSDIAVAIADIRSLDRQIGAAREALPVLERLVESAQKAIAQSNVDVLSYYTARNNLLQKRIQLIKLEEQLLEARTALEIASGRYMPSDAVLGSQ